MGTMSREKLVRMAGVLILVGGLMAAVWLYLTAADQPVDPVAIDADTGLDDGLHPEDFKGYSRSMEVMGGKIWIILASWQRGLATLGQGRPLAVLVGLAAIAVGLTLLRAARPPATPDATDRADRDIPGPPAGGA